MTWDEFAAEWRGWIEGCVPTGELASLGGKVPDAWLAMARNPDSQHVDEIWGSSRQALPRFIERLSSTLLDVRIARSRTGPLLAYQLKDWLELEWDEFADGWMIAGLPLGAQQLGNWEMEQGQVPPALRALWLTHGSLLIKDDIFLASLDPLQQKQAGAPSAYGIKQERMKPERRLECMGLVNVSSDLPTCLSRVPGAPLWDDCLVDCERWGDAMYESLRTRLDDLLTDWRLNEWPLDAQAASVR